MPSIFCHEMDSIQEPKKAKMMLGGYTTRLGDPFDQIPGILEYKSCFRFCHFERRTGFYNLMIAAGGRLAILSGWMDFAFFFIFHLVRMPLILD